MSVPGDGDSTSLGIDERAALIAAHERRVAAMHNSAQYRVGELVISSTRSARRLLRLPLDLWRLRRDLLAEHRSTPLASNTARPNRDVVAATILDEVSYRALAPEWDQQPLDAEAPTERLKALRPDLLFVESAWEGNDGAFRGELADIAPRAHALIGDVLSGAALAGVPTAFWNSDDPVHFDTFAAVAARFDWIFTTDADCIERYVALAGHDRVAALPLAVQPRVHNPIGMAPDRLARACSAGGDRGDTRWDNLIRPIVDAGLADIVESTTSSIDDYRRYACFLDVGSGTAAPAKDARRIFELLACRTPVVSTPSPAIEELFGDAVVTVETQNDARAAVEHLVGDRQHRDRVGHRGYRTVMSRHTYGHRVDVVLDCLGIARPPLEPSVTVLAPTNRPEFLDRLLDNFRRQRAVDADLIVLTNSDRFDRDDVDRRVAEIAGARALHLAAGLTIGECLNAGLAASDSRFVAKFDDDDHYGDHYLHDALLVHRFADAAIVGKKSFYAYLERTDETILRFPGNEFTSANRVSGSTMLIDRDIFGDARFAALNVGEDVDLCEQALARRMMVFSSDRFNYVAVRRGDLRSHSWTIDDNDYRAGSVKVARGLALEHTMV